jgi:hypothetical protein
MFVKTPTDLVDPPWVFIILVIVLLFLLIVMLVVVVLSAPWTGRRR